MAKPAYGAAHQRARKALLADDPLCVHCGTQLATIADHQPPLSLHDHVEGTGCCAYVPSCESCSLKQAGDLSALRRLAGQVKLEEPPACPGPEHPMWDVPWLDDLREVPENATWPRFMTAPHPRATSSWGPQFCDDVEARLGPLRWWQRLFAYRVLERDDDWNLVWWQWFLSVARQLGKSHAIRELLVWAAGLPGNPPRPIFGHADLHLLVSRRVATSESIMRPVLLWAKTEERRDPEGFDWHAVNAPGRMALWHKPNDVSLQVRSADMAYGETVGLAVVDECWDVRESLITEGVEPTVLASEGILGFTSTAHRKTTSLAINRRAEALKGMHDASEEILILEWSADRERSVEDRDGWRQASPYWTPRREAMMASRLERARNGESVDPDEPDPIAAFEAQYLNRWPLSFARQGRGEALVTVDTWAGALDTSARPAHQLVVAIEDNGGQGCAVAVAGLDDQERPCVDGRTFDTRLEAVEWANDRRADTILLGASLVNDPESRQLVGFVHTRGSNETKADIATFRHLASTRRLFHPGGHELAEQACNTLVRSTGSGLVMQADRRHDLAKAAVWAVAEVDRQRGLGPQVH